MAFFKLVHSPKLISRKIWICIRILVSMTILRIFKNGMFELSRNNFLILLQYWNTIFKYVVSKRMPRFSLFSKLWYIHKIRKKYLEPILTIVDEIWPFLAAAVRKSPTHKFRYAKTPSNGRTLFVVRLRCLFLITKKLSTIS